MKETVEAQLVCKSVGSKQSFISAAFGVSSPLVKRVHVSHTNLEECKVHNS
ncbi:UNVERIFIED_CONTAM: hypothetical protein FKN15_076942 [Acipenser sinensis]